MKEQLSLKLMRDKKNNFPIKAVQFGEGSFIRGFLNELLYRLNDNNLFNGASVAIAPTNRNKIVPLLKEQDCLFTTVLHGIHSELYTAESYTEKIDVINTIVDAINPYQEWQKVLDLAKLDSLKYIFSNTTEAGIVYKKQKLEDGVCPDSFPAKLTVFLYTRYKHFKDSCTCGHGLYIMPLELVEQNATTLKDIVKRHAEDFGYEEAFFEFLYEDCQFLNTLVDRVISGYPKESSSVFDKLPYEDKLITEGELYHCMIIEGSSDIESLLPFKNIGLNVEYVNDIRPYAYRKLRILNAGHTVNVAYSYLKGINTVYESMQDNNICKFTLSLIKDEIVPNLILDKDELLKYVDDTYKRFNDPQLHHKLESILLNTSSKFRSRVLPTIIDARKKNILPKKMLFAFAATLCLYKELGDGQVKVVREDGSVGYFIDDMKNATLLNDAWQYYKKTEDSAMFVASRALALSDVWGIDLSSDIELCALVAKYMHAISSDGINLVIEDLMLE